MANTPSVLVSELYLQLIRWTHQFLLFLLLLLLLLHHHHHHLLLLLEIIGLLNQIWIRVGVLKKRVNRSVRNQTRWPEMSIDVRRKPTAGFRERVEKEARESWRKEFFFSLF
ncbi:unnamed protein product [Arabidopsis halleri]